MTEPVVYAGVALVATVIVGVALLRAGMDLAAAVQRADDALYRAKKVGRGSAAAEAVDP